ncbi:MAG: hypothetical protein ABI175_11675, partial [Polyangiales bacterium]
MDILQTRVAFRERTLPDVVDLSLRFTVAHARAYLKVAAATILPLVVGTFFLAREATPFVTWSCVFVAIIFAEAPFTILASRLVFAETVPTGVVLKETARALPKLVVLVASQLAAIAAATSMLIIPGIWLGVAWHFTFEVLLLERASTFGAFSRSQRMISGAFGEAAVALGTRTLIDIAVIVLAEYAGRSLLEDFLQVTPPQSLWSGGAGLLSLAGVWLWVPFRATLRFFVYLDLR